MDCDPGWHRGKHITADAQTLRPCSSPLGFKRWRNDKTYFHHGLLAEAVRAMRIGAIGGGSRARFDEPVPVYGRILAWLWLRVQSFRHLASGCFLFCTRDGFEAAGR